MEDMKQKAYKAMVKLMRGALARNLLPDFILRSLMRLEYASRLQPFYKLSSELQLSNLLHFVNSLKEMPITIHSEVVESNITPFLKLVLGRYLKLSCCYFADTHTTLDDAEEAMLELYCERSELKDGHTVLDVGCGWGSLLLYIAQKYSNCKVTGICNSKIQKEYIDDHCRDLKLKNVEVILADITTFEMEGSYDRILSIEMFEHMKNYRDLLKKISNWMKPDGLLFVHHFCHKTFGYHLEDFSEDEWFTQLFFRRGTIPSSNLLLYFQDDVSIVNHWLVNGKHYAQTCKEWLNRMDRNLSYIRPILEALCGKDLAAKMKANFRSTFIANVELYGYKNGEEWMVAHFLFKKKQGC